MSFVEVVRGGWGESRDRVEVEVTDAVGRVVTSTGDTGALTLYRSAAEPMQALPRVEEGVAGEIRPAFTLDRSRPRPTAVRATSTILEH